MYGPWTPQEHRAGVRGDGRQLAHGQEVGPGERRRLGTGMAFIRVEHINNLVDVVNRMHRRRM
jgi:hypothetical protein